ncbi:MAG: nuclear transport factor 2 family protein [Mucilaginibacter sp.]
MNTQQVADRLAALCREGKNMDAINELYDDKIVSQEMKGMPMERAEGIEAVKGKSEYWYNSVEEIHGVEISDAIVTGNFFSIAMEMDVTYKEHGRTNMHEIAVYEVRNGKIVFEQFFYNM